MKYIIIYLAISIWFTVFAVLFSEIKSTETISYFKTKKGFIILIKIIIWPWMLFVFFIDDMRYRISKGVKNE